MPTMKTKYQQEVAPALMEKFQYKSVMQIPKLDKIVVSVGCGDCKDNAKALDAVIKDITAITGQKAVATVAKKSVANFKLREGMHVGVKVTLRQDRMWEFLDRLFNVALPRVRDFRGISADAFDGRGNYSLGLKEQIIFPEIEYDKIEKLRGMNIAIKVYRPVVAGIFQFWHIFHINSRQHDLASADGVKEKEIVVPILHSCRRVIQFIVLTQRNARHISVGTG